MQKEIKNHLFNKKIGLIFLSFLVLVCLLLPLKRVEAIIGTGIFDFFETALGGIEEKAAPLAKQIIMVFITYVVSLIALYTSSNLLDLVIREQSNWLTVQNSPLVQAGWRFTSGLANLFLILIFVTIAIAYILKIETFQAKKALPRLIIIALLLNFSLVFVGVFVDIANIFYNTVLQGNEGLATQFIGILGAGGNDVLLNIMLWIGLLAGLFIIPFVGPFAQLAFVLLFVGVGFLPNIMTWVFQIVLFLMISGVFFLYIFLFSVRVFLIQILAILAPLAFICLILPQTRKHWNEWLQHLLEWSFLGISLLFFFVIGIRAANAIIPPGGLTPIPFLGWGKITAYFTYYFFLFIYFILVLWVNNKFMPTLAAFIVSQATSWGNFAWQRAIKPFGKVFQKSGERVWREKMPKRAREWGDRQLIKPIWGADVTGAKGAAKRAIGAVPYALRRGFGRAVGGIGIAEAERKDMQRTETEAGKRDVVGNLSTLRATIVEAERAGIITAMIDKNQIKAALDENIVGKGNKLSDQEVLTSYRKARELENKDATEKIEYSFARLANEFAKIVDEETKNYTQDKKTTKGLNQEDSQSIVQGGKGYTSYADKIIDSAKSFDDIKKFQKGWWENKDLMEATHKFWTGAQLSKAADQFGREFVEKYMGVVNNTVKKIGVDAYVKINPRAALYLSGNAAQDLGFRSPAGLKREDIKKLIK